MLVSGTKGATTVATKKCANRFHRGESRMQHQAWCARSIGTQKQPQATSTAAQSKNYRQCTLSVAAHGSKTGHKTHKNTPANPQHSTHPVHRHRKQALARHSGAPSVYVKPAPRPTTHPCQRTRTHNKKTPPGAPQASPSMDRTCYTCTGAPSAKHPPDTTPPAPHPVLPAIS